MGRAPADVVGKVLQADFGFRPRDADHPYEPATRPVLLSPEHVLDAGSNSALLAVRVLLRLGADDCGSCNDESGCAIRTS